MRAVLDYVARDSRDNGRGGPARMGEPCLTALMPLAHYHPTFLAKPLGSLQRQSDPRVALAPNAGRKLAGAFNTGMRLAETDFVAILLGDDLWSHAAVATLHAYLERYPQADFLHSARRIVNERDEPISSIHPSQEHVRLDDFFHSSPVKHLLCWRRDLGLAIGGMDESLD